MSTLTTIDSLDDRREIWSLLHRLSPRARVSFLAWCCTQVKGKLRPIASSRMGPTVEMAYRCDRADDRLTNEIYGDMLALSCNHQLDLVATALELTRRVRRPTRLP